MMGLRLPRRATGRRRTWQVPALLILLIALFAIIGPWLSPYTPAQTDWNAMTQPPTLQGAHWLGTDALGRDLLVRLLSGARMSLLVGIVATLVSLLVGVSWGMLAGYLGGRVDALMMRWVDVLYALPFLFLVILLMVVFNRHVVLLFVAIGAVNWLDMARIVRGQTRVLRGAAFVDAARLNGCRVPVILGRHILPNLAGVIAAYATLLIPQAILLESLLSFLGLGVQPPDTSWGVLISEGASQMETAPWLLLCPALSMALALWSFNALGEALRNRWVQEGERQ